MSKCVSITQFRPEGLTKTCREVSCLRQVDGEVKLERLRLAYQVFKGEMDVVKWEGGQ